MRGVLLRLIVLMAVVAVIYTGLTWTSAIAPVDRPQASAFKAVDVKTGSDLAAIGNCLTCHTKQGGQPFSGGRAIDTPFGKVLATNITPDADTGIGRWSESAFSRAMRDGVGRDGRHLYPAFPYDHMTKVTDADIGAVYAYMMTRTAVKAETPASALAFPFNQRWLIGGWKLVFLSRGAYTPDNARSAEWNRGAYLVEGVAHCGACHTPRNTLGAENKRNPYGGAMVDGFHAPAINAASPAAVPWTAERVFDYLRRGQSRQHGVATGPMAEVVQNLATVSDGDLKAMATYVAAIAGEPTKERKDQGEKAVARAAGTAPTRSGAAAAPAGAGGSIYAGACAQCHGEAGRTPIGPALNLALSSAVRGADASKLVRVVMGGITPVGNAPGAIMPGYAAALSDSQVADLVGYVRASFGEGPAFAGVADAIKKAR